MVVGLIAAACGDDSPAGLAGMVREPPPNVGSVALPDGSAGGRDFATKAAAGQLLLVYFGYTACPDVCPTTLADLRNAVQLLGEDANRITVAMVTVDPDRDVPEQLTLYVQAFFDGGHSLRTDDLQVLRRAADAFGADYDVTENADGIVEVAHTAFLYVVDSNGRVLVQWPFGTPSEDMRNDLAYLFERGV